MGWITRAKHWMKEKALAFVGFQKVRMITIEPGVLDDLSEMAREAHPKEMLAFFSATKGNQRGRVHIDEIQLQAYDASTNSAHVWLHNMPTFTNIVGTCHSHPSANRRPSRADLRFWSRYGYVHAIIGAPYNRASVTFYDKNGSFLPVPIVRRR